MAQVSKLVLKLPECHACEICRLGCYALCRVTCTYEVIHSPVVAFCRLVVQPAVMGRYKPEHMVVHVMNTLCKEFLANVVGYNLYVSLQTIYVGEDMMVDAL